MVVTVVIVAVCGGDCGDCGCVCGGDCGCV